MKLKHRKKLHFLYPETITIVNISICLLHFFNLKIPFNIFFINYYFSLNAKKYVHICGKVCSVHIYRLIPWCTFFVI